MSISEDARGGEEFERCNRSMPAHASGRFRALVVFLGALWLAACSGGGGSGDSPPPPPPVSGYVVKGPIAAATVKLYTIATDGTKTLLGATTSDPSGFYSFNVAPGIDSVILVEASGGDYEDEISATRVPLAGTLRAAAIVSSAALRVSISPFSEAAVREIEATPKNWAAARVGEVHAAFSKNLGVGSFLALTPADLGSDAAAQNASDDDFLLALDLGGFSGMLHRLGSPSTPAPLDQGLNALRTAISDPLDDRYNPIWLRGIVDFIDVTGLSAGVKRELKGILLLQNRFASDADIAAALPTGQATGSTTAAMPNDAFEFVPDPYSAPQSPVRTLFNTRGALVAYDLSSSFSLYRYLYSASVGELYGDGDIGIGRWHGGVAFDATDTRTLNTLVLDASQGISYAVARPATSSPPCGIRFLQLVGATLPTQTAGPGTKPVTGLTADSSIGVQYAGATAYLGLDIGLQMTDGTVYRVRTTGGSTTPWASGMSTAPNQSFSTFFYAPAPPSQLPGLHIDANGMLAGAGGRKAVVKLLIYSTSVDAMTFAAAFSGADTPPDSAGCAVSSPGDGGAIVPPPADGTYAVFAATDYSNSLYMGAPFPASFRATGALTAAPSLTIPVDTPMFELAGNPYAAIGRANGAFTLRGVNYNRSLPYAVAQAPGIFPTTGTRRYVLAASSAAIATVGSGANIFELPPGEITHATLDINFGEFPLGTASQWYGSVRYSIEGSVAGASFGISNPLDSTGAISDGIYYRGGGTFNGSGFVEGAVSGPNAEFAVVRYQSGIGSAPVQGVLFLQAQ